MELAIREKPPGVRSMPVWIKFTQVKLLPDPAEAAVGVLMSPKKVRMVRMREPREAFLALPSLVVLARWRRSGDRYLTDSDREGPTPGGTGRTGEQISGRTSRNSSATLSL